MCFKSRGERNIFSLYVNRYLFIVLGIMGVIFFLSHTPGEESAKQSGLIVTLLSYLPIKIDESNINILTLIIRKGAHMTEYFLLTLSLVKYFKSVQYEVKLQWSKIYFWSGIIAFLYACSDEFHQTFIPGRAGLFTDVLVDSVGIIFALITVFGFMKFYKRASN